VLPDTPNSRATSVTGRVIAACIAYDQQSTHNLACQLPYPVSIGEVHRWQFLAVVIEELQLVSNSVSVACIDIN